MITLNVLIGNTSLGGSLSAGATGIPVNALLDEDGSPLLDEDGSYLLDE